MLKIIFEDADILVVEKPSGVESQSSRGFEPDMVSEIKNHLRLSTKISTKASTNGGNNRGEPYVGVIHRLDKPVGGVMVYAKTQKAAASLSRQVQERKMDKFYWAVLCGKPVDIVGNYVDYLLRDGKTNHSTVVDKNVDESKRAELSYQILKSVDQEDQEIPVISLAEIRLLTGRHHQIRVQFAARNTPLWGDNKYNPLWSGNDRRQGSLALCAVRLSFYHPRTGEKMTFSAEPRGTVFELFNPSKI